jgi:hypothetical protein
MILLSTGSCYNMLFAEGIIEIHEVLSKNTGGSPAGFQLPVVHFTKRHYAQVVVPTEVD